MKENKQILLQTISVLPTNFSVDIWVCNNPDLIAKAFHKRYGAAIDYYKNHTSENQVATIYSTKDSDLGGKSRIVMNVESFIQLL